MQKIITTPFTREKIKIELLTFKDLRYLLNIIYDKDTGVFDKVELLYDYLKVSNLNQLDKIYVAFKKVVESFDRNMLFKSTCKNPRCKIPKEIEIYPEFSDMNINRSINGLTFSNLDVVNPLNCFDENAQNELLNERTVKEYKDTLIQLSERLESIFETDIAYFEHNYTCKFCKTENTFYVGYKSIVDLIIYIKQNYSIKYYYTMISIMKNYGYSILELNDMSVGEVNYIMNLENFRRKKS